MKTAALEADARRVLIVALLYCLPLVAAMHPVLDPDVWWHLRTGQWIVSHGQVPVTDSFSSYGAGKPWIAYSWLFEILLYRLHESFGLSGILFFTAGMALLATFSLHVLVRQAKFSLVTEVLLVAATVGGMAPLMSPRPWLFSIVFSTLQLIVLRNFTRTRSRAVLWLLPPLYALWANLHIQFVYGLAILCLFIVAGIVRAAGGDALPSERSQRPPLRPLLAVTAACALAALANPYGYQLYRQVIEFGLLAQEFQLIRELQAMTFHSPADWLAVAAALAAAVTLGAKGRLTDFPALLLVMGCFLGFKSARDVWVMVLAAAFVLSDRPVTGASAEELRFTPLKVAAAMAALALTAGLIALNRNVSEKSLRAALESHYPVKAVEFVSRNRYPGPLFNGFDWGGYLIWSLPGIPVSIDGRGNIHAGHVESAFRTWSGHPGWEKDRELMAARLVIAEVTAPLTALLRRDSPFHVVYEDATTVVFVRKQ